MLRCTGWYCQRFLRCRRWYDLGPIAYAVVSFGGTDCLSHRHLHDSPSLRCLPVYLPAKWGIGVPAAVPYLVGGAVGGCLAGLLYPKIPTKWLHRALGLLIVYGGVRLALW